METRPSSDLLAGITIEPFGARVPAENGPIQRFADDGVPGRFNNGRELEGRFFPSFAPCVIADHGGDLRDITRVEGNEINVYGKLTSVSSFCRKVPVPRPLSGAWASPYSLSVPRHALRRSVPAREFQPVCR